MPTRHVLFLIASTREPGSSVTPASTLARSATTESTTTAPAPTIADISTDVYWETDNQTPASKIGRHFFND